MKASVIERGSALNKTLSVLMALVLAVSLAPLPAYAETPGEPAPKQEQQLDPAPETPGEPVVETQGEPNADSPAKPATTPVEPEADSPVELVGASSSSPAEQVNTTVPEPAATGSANSATPASRTFTGAVTSIELEVTANDAATAAALGSAVLQVRTADQITNAETAKAAFGAQAGEDTAIDLYEIKLVSNGADLALAAADTATITLPAAAQSTIWGYREGQVVKLESAYADGKTTAKVRELGLIAVANPATEEQVAENSAKLQVMAAAAEKADYDEDYWRNTLGWQSKPPAYYSSVDSMQPGKYNVNANLYIPGEENKVLPGVNANFTNTAFPPDSAVLGFNAKLIVGTDGRATLELDVVNRVFTLQSIGGGTNAEITEAVRDDVDYTHPFDTSDVKVHGRIVHISVALNDLGSRPKSWCNGRSVIAGIA